MSIRKRETGSSARRGTAACSIAGYAAIGVRAAARRVALAGVIGSLALCAGCGSVVTLDGERLGVRSDAFRDYVERVFREQNRVATALAFALEDERDPERLDVLESAEAALLDACAGLNEIAALRRDGDRLGRLRALDAARAAPACERAAAEAEALLK